MKSRKSRPAGKSTSKTSKTRKNSSKRSKKGRDKREIANTGADRESLMVANPDAAGVDIGSEEHWACVPPDRVEKDGENIRVIGCCTPDLHKLIAWFKDCGIKTVALESTGVYWIPLYQLLEKAKFEVCLVNTKHMKNVKGRPKTDRLDCQWLMRLHSYGLLQPSFRPADDVCALRSLVRWRDTLTMNSADYIRRMCKALQEMNVRLDKAVTDVTGATGLRIIEAILAGERDPYALAALRDVRCKKSKKEIARLLSGDFRPEHLYVLGEAYGLYKEFLSRVADCESEIERLLRNLTPTKEALWAAYEKVVAAIGTDHPAEEMAERVMEEAFPESYKDMKTHLKGLLGVDATAIPGFDTLTVQTLISEIGLDFTRWADTKRFSAWLGLAPCPQRSGTMKKGQHTAQVLNRAAKALRMAALAVSESQTHVGAFYRRIRFHSGGAAAITATAHKLAVIYYSMVVKQNEFVELGVDHANKRNTKKFVARTTRKLAELGYKVVPVEESEAEMEKLEKTG